MTQYEDVREFHLAFNHPVGLEPNALDADLVEKRVKWMREEIDEFVEAAENGDIVEMYDAMIDLDYFCKGTLVAMGTAPEPGWQAVHRANMAKLHDVDGTPTAVYDEYGKVIKPEGWVAPDHTETIEKMKDEAKIESLAVQFAALDNPNMLVTITDVPAGILYEAFRRGTNIRFYRERLEREQAAAEAGDAQ